MTGDAVVGAVGLSVANDAQQGSVRQQIASSIAGFCLLQTIMEVLMVLATIPKTPTDEVVSPNKRTIKKVFREPSTWAGLLSIAAAVLTGGASALTDPALLSQIGAGLALVLARES